MVRTTLVALSLAVACLSEVAAQVTFERLLEADQEPHNWLTYSGTHSGERHSRLEQITPENVGELELEWVFQAQSLQVFETTPLVVDGVMYLTEAPNTVVALDARTGRVFWTYEHTPSLASRPCCGRVNRGLAILGETLFMATIDAQLIAVDAVTGRPIWKTLVADPAIGYAMTLAPLVVKDKIVVGVAGGEYGIRGFIAAYYAETGDEAWRFHTIPGPGEPGHDTWPSDSDAWEHGGSATWLTGTYDSDLNLIYWGTGNPGPDFNPDQRLGDNLYSDSVVALDADSGELKWHFQFTPNDPYDYDSVQIPVLVDYPANDGSTLKLMLWDSSMDNHLLTLTGLTDSTTTDVRSRRRSHQGQLPIPVFRVERTGIRRPTARAHDSFMFQRGKGMARSSHPPNRSISLVRILEEVPWTSVRCHRLAVVR